MWNINNTIYKLFKIQSLSVEHRDANCIVGVGELIIIPRPNYYALNYSGSYVAKLYCYYGKPLIGSRQRS